MQLKHVEPEVKFVLVAFVQHFGLADGESRTVEARAGLLGLPVRVVASALAQLVDTGWLVKQAMSTPGSSGRPKRSYQVQADLAAALVATVVPTFIHERIIKHLIAGPVIRAVGPDDGGDGAGAVQSTKLIDEFGKPVPPGRRGNLSLANRLLLAALLSRADAFGVVSDLGNVELVQLTGLAPATLRQRVLKLIALGFIRSYVPGVSSSIFSRKVRSTYFLNLSHRQLTQEPAFQVLSHWTLERSEIRFQHHGDMLRNDVAAAMDGAQNGRTAPWTVIQFLWRQRRGVFNAVQLHLAKYASYLLSSHWSNLGGHTGRIDGEALRKMISSDFRKPTASPPADAERVEREWQEVIEYFCELVFEMAEDFKSRFEQAPWVFFELLDIRILPVPDKHGYEAITLLVRGSSEQCGLILGRDGIGGVRAFDHEADIPLDERYLFGLLTGPKDKVFKR
jgi:hypothetical protein